MQVVHPCGITKDIPEGFSFTTLLFGYFVPLFRGDLKWFAIIFIVSLINYFLCGILIGFLTTPIWWILSAAAYNEWYMNDMLMKGFRKV